MDTKILDRIQKLMNLANSPNEHEATAAATMAAKLMADHGIKQAQLEVECGRAHKEDRPEAADLSKTATPWEQALAQGVASAHGCRMYLQPRHGRPGNEIRLFGLPDDVKAATYMFQYLSRVVTDQASRTMRSDRGYRNAFRYGMASRIRDRLVESKRQSEREIATQYNGSAALAVVKRDALRVREAWAQFSVGFGRARPVNMSSASGFADGQAAGARVGIGSGGPALPAGAQRHGARS